MDNARLGRVQITVLALCTMVTALEGYDLLAIAFAAPVIANEWAVTPEALGILFGAGPVGLALGALLLAPLGDRIGRKPTILLCMAILGISTLLSGFAGSYTQLLILRLGIGIGMGGATPCLETITAEYSSNRLRNLFISVVTNGFMIGAIAGGATSALLIEQFGWQSIFLIGGAASLLFIIPVAVYLPESIHFLARSEQPATRARLVAILRKVTADLDPNTTFRVSGPAAKQERLSLLLVLTPPFRTATLFMWLAFFTYFYCLYTLMQWIPTILSANGFATSQAIVAGTILSIGGGIGSLLLGAMTTDKNLRPMILAFFLLSTLVLWPLGLLLSRVALTMTAIFLAGFMINGGGVGLFMLAARFYPSDRRATGIGWCSVFGRLGAISGPVVAGYLVGAQIDWRVFFLLLGCVPLASVVGVFQVPFGSTGANQTETGATVHGSGNGTTIGPRNSSRLR